MERLVVVRKDRVNNCVESWKNKIDFGKHGRRDTKIEHEHNI